MSQEKLKITPLKSAKKLELLVSQSPLAVDHANTSKKRKKRDSLPGPHLNSTKKAKLQTSNLNANDDHDSDFKAHSEDSDTEIVASPAHPSKLSPFKGVKSPSTTASSELADSSSYLLLTNTDGKFNESEAKEFFGDVPIQHISKLKSPLVVVRVSSIDDAEKVSKLCREKLYAHKRLGALQVSGSVESLYPLMNLPVVQVVDLPENCGTKSISELVPDTIKVVEIKIIPLEKNSKCFIKFLSTSDASATCEAINSKSSFHAALLNDPLSSSTIRISGLPSTSVEELRSHFPTSLSVVLSSKNDANFGFIKFKDQKSRDSALAQNSGLKISGVSVQLKPWKDGHSDIVKGDENAFKFVSRKQDCTIKYLKSLGLNRVMQLHKNLFISVFTSHNDFLKLYEKLRKRPDFFVFSPIHISPSGFLACNLPYTLTNPTDEFPGATSVKPLTSDKGYFGEVLVEFSTFEQCKSFIASHPKMVIQERYVKIIPADISALRSDSDSQSKPDKATSNNKQDKELQKKEVQSKHPKAVNKTDTAQEATIVANTKVKQPIKQESDDDDDQEDHLDVDEEEDDDDEDSDEVSGDDEDEDDEEDDDDEDDDEEDEDKESDQIKTKTNSIAKINGKHKARIEVEESDSGEVEDDDEDDEDEDDDEEMESQSSDDDAQTNLKSKVQSSVNSNRGRGGSFGNSPNSFRRGRGFGGDRGGSRGKNNFNQRGRYFEGNRGNGRGRFRENSNSFRGKPSNNQRGGSNGRFQRRPFRGSR